MSYNFNTMKVAQLRKLVSENNIFSGGLSSMKKKDLIDKIYESEWYHLNYKPVEELTEREQLERKLQLLQNQLKSEPKEVIETVEEIKEDVPEVIEEPVEEHKQEDDLNYRINKAVQEALLKQREQMVAKLFG